MLQAIINFLNNIVGPELCVFLCSMLPVIELRGAFPIGAVCNLPFWSTYILCVLGNMLPVPFILLGINRMIQWMSSCSIKLCNRCANWLLAKVEAKRARIERYSFWGLAFFVCLPLPGTGAWTGSLIAATIGMPFRKSICATTLGVCCAGFIMGILSYGVTMIV